MIVKVKRILEDYEATIRYWVVMVLSLLTIILWTIVVCLPAEVVCLNEDIYWQEKEGVSELSEEDQKLEKEAVALLKTKCIEAVEKANNEEIEDAFIVVGIDYWTGTGGSAKFVYLTTSGKMGRYALKGNAVEKIAFGVHFGPEQRRGEGFSDRINEFDTSFVETLKLYVDNQKIISRNYTGTIVLS